MGEVLSPRHWGEMKPPKVAKTLDLRIPGLSISSPEGIVPTGGEPKKASRLDKQGVPQPPDLIPDDLRCSNAIKIGK